MYAPHSKVAIFIDGGNIEHSLSELEKGLMLDYDSFIPQIVGVRQLTVFHYFREGLTISDSFEKRLHEKFAAKVTLCNKSADIPLALEATDPETLEQYDTCILLSGDQDFVPLVTKLMWQYNKFVEIAAVYHSLASMYEGLVDKIHYINHANCYKL